jgi:hypothetical protein
MYRNAQRTKRDGADAVHPKTALPAAAKLQEIKMAAGMSGGHFFDESESQGKALEDLLRAP